MAQSPDEKTMKFTIKMYKETKKLKKIKVWPAQKVKVFYVLPHFSNPRKQGI